MVKELGFFYFIYIQEVMIDIIQFVFIGFSFEGENMEVVEVGYFMFSLDLGVYLQSFFFQENVDF